MLNFVINFRENIENSKEFKEGYLSGINRLIEKREEAAQGKRELFCEKIFREPEKHRNMFKQMLGWPLVGEVTKEVPEVRVEKLKEDVACTIYRMSFEVLDGLHMTGLFFQKDEKKRPLVIAQHGGWGTPEHIANLYGHTSNYNNMVERMLQYDVNVFAPQLLLWKEAYGVGFDRAAIDAKLKRVGSSITAIEVYGITRILDYFEAQEYVSNFGMIGLSYGGFYTLFTSAIDLRIKSAVSCSYFNRRKDYANCDWSWYNAAESFSDAEIACLVYPRKLCIEVGDEDELFSVEGAREEYCFLQKVCQKFTSDWSVDFIEFSGTHEFCKDDLPLKRLAEDIQ